MTVGIRTAEEEMQGRLESGNSWENESMLNEVVLAVRVRRLDADFHTSQNAAFQE